MSSNQQQQQEKSTNLSTDEMNTSTLNELEESVTQVDLRTTTEMQNNHQQQQQQQQTPKLNYNPYKSLSTNSYYGNLTTPPYYSNDTITTSFYSNQQQQQQQFRQLHSNTNKGNTPVGTGDSSPSSVSDYDVGGDQQFQQQQQQQYFYPPTYPFHYQTFPATHYQQYHHLHQQNFPHHQHQHHHHQQQQHHQQHHNHQNHYQSPHTSISKTNLYIRGLSEATSDQDLYDMCQSYGQIKSTKAIIDKQTLKCKGYGFVDFKNQEDAQFALKKLKEQDTDVQLAKQREQDPTNLYFANLPHSVDEDALTELLQTRFNVQVSSTRIMRERNGNSKGVGFARIDESNVCDRIIQELNQKPYPELVDGVATNRVLLVKLADSGNAKRQRNLTSSSSSSIINTPNHNQQQQQQQQIHPSHHLHPHTTPVSTPNASFAPMPINSFNGFPIFNSFSDGTQTPLSATPTAALSAPLNFIPHMRNAPVQYVPQTAYVIQQTATNNALNNSKELPTNSAPANNNNNNNSNNVQSSMSNSNEQQYTHIQQQFAGMSLINGPPQYYTQSSTELYNSNGNQSSNGN